MNNPNYSMEALFEIWSDSSRKTKEQDAIAFAYWYQDDDDAKADFLKRISAKRAELEGIGYRVSLLSKKLIFLPTNTEIKLPR